MKFIREISLNRVSDSDFIGAIASVLCVIHCALTPFLFAAQAAISSSCKDIGPLWWKLIDFFFLIITFFAIYYTTKSTQLKWLPFVLYSLWSLLALLLVIKFYNLFDVPHSIMYVLAIGLSSLHIYNRHYCLCQKNNSYV